MRFDPEDRERADALAEAWRTSFTDIVRMALKRFLDDAEAGQIGPGGTPTVAARVTAQAVIEILKQQELLLTEEDRALIARARKGLG